MDQFIQAYDMGRRQARLDFEKSAGAKDVAEVLKALGSGASAGTSALGKGLKKLMGGAEFAGRGAKYLGTVADPRAALLLGSGLAVGGGVIAPAAMHAAEGLVPAAKAALPGALAALGGGLAMGANPGMMGGSMANRLSHELAMMSATPAGQVAAIASVVGLPAALIAYGKKKGREESSLF